jgi:hypothetical protein
MKNRVPPTRDAVDVAQEFCPRALMACSTCLACTSSSLTSACFP